MFFREVNEFACTRLCEWVKSGYVNKCNEGFIFAAQEQTLATNRFKSKD